MYHHLLYSFLTVVSTTKGPLYYNHHYYFANPMSFSPFIPSQCYTNVLSTRSTFKLCPLQPYSAVLSRNLIWTIMEPGSCHAHTNWPDSSLLWTLLRCFVCCIAAWHHALCNAWNSLHICLQKILYTPKCFTYGLGDDFEIKGCLTPV